MARTYLTVSPYGGFPHLFIATAAYQFHPNYTHSLAAAMPLLQQHGIAVDLCHLAEHCHVDDARNALVREFLMSKATHLVFIDNDVGFSPESLLRLAQHDRDMVAGVYPLKEEGEGGFPVRLPDGVELWADDDGLVEVVGLPTGFLKISRKCIETLIADEPRKFYGRGQSTDDLPHHILFERTYINGVRCSGDYAFCEKWKANGGKMYVDPEMTFTHSGTKEWSGTLGDYWRKEFGVNEQRFDEAIARMKTGRFDAETAAWLIAGWGNPYCAGVNTLVSAWHSAKKARTILETGSGLTTLVLALSNPSSSVISLESDAIYASSTQEVLDKHGIENVTLAYAPLDDGWYRFEQGMYRFDLVVLDGPNRKKGDRNLAFERLNLEGSTVLIDDADDASLLAGFTQWADSQGREVVLLGINDKSTAISLPKERIAA